MGQQIKSSDHGVVCGAPDLFRAFMAFETLESCARLEIDATRVGKLRPLTLEQVIKAALKKMMKG